MTSVDVTFWRGKRVLLTGHTGFKGSWLAVWLSRLGAEVTGLALVADARSLYREAGVDSLLTSHETDLRDAAGVARIVRDARPEIVLHLAAQALVRESYRDPLATYASNVMGTAHVLDAVRAVDGVRSVVVVTTDKVYRNREWVYPYREDDALGGHDPYSASKAAAELVTASFRDAYLRARGVAVSTARAGNVIGGGDFAADRLVPDAVRAWEAGATLRLRRPAAIRPWQHVLDPLAGYLRLAERQWHDASLAGAYNFGPATGEALSVGDVVALAREAYGRGAWQIEGEGEGPHEAGQLALEVAHARGVLGVEANWALPVAIERTMSWYRQRAEGASAPDLCAADIDAYAHALRPMHASPASASGHAPSAIAIRS